jgi:lipopolysaccharide export system permease protein
MAVSMAETNGSKITDGHLDHTAQAVDCRRMRFPRTLSTQVVLEQSAYGALGFIAAVTVLVSQNVIRRMESIFMIGFSLDDVLTAMGSLVPMVAAYAAPIAFLLGATLTIQRMSSEREIVAMQSCGVGLSALLWPTVALGVVMSLLTGYLILSVEHQGRRQLIELFQRTATKGGIIEPGRFKSIGSRLFFVNGIDREKRLEGVMILDQSNPRRQSHIFAERGRFGFDDETQMLRFTLEDGDIHLTPPPDNPEQYHRIAFDQLDYAFDISSLLGQAFSPNRPRQMRLDELRAVLVRAEEGEPLDGLDQRNPVEYALEIQRRFALPFAPLLFALLVVPLGMQITRGGRPFGILLSLAVAVLYYGLLVLGQSLARYELVSPIVGMWLANVVLLALAIGLLRRHRGVRATGG